MKTICTIAFALFLSFNLAIAQDTLYLYKSGAVVNKRAIAQIDSIAFYRANSSTQSNTVTDIDGNVYHTVTIGSQVWMVENLKVTHYRNCDAITYVTDNTSFWSLSATGEYCYYNNDEASNKTTYGALYNWHAVNDSRNICPVGWHVPTDTEWTTLSLYLGGELVAGGKLKESGTSHWNSPNEGATNETGFDALPGGSCTIKFDLKFGYWGYWWSSTEDKNITFAAWSYRLNYYDYSFVRQTENKYIGFSVRCIKD